MMSNKGFIISTTLYSAFGIMMITVATILFVLSNKQATMSSMTDRLKLCIEECDTPENICKDVCRSGNTPYDKIISDNTLITSTVITKDSCAEGLFVDMDNYGATVFFRGNVNNNYMKYGKDQNGNDLLWRIVRVNGDGSLRLILNENVKYSLLDIDGNEILIDGIDDTVHQIYPSKGYENAYNDFGSVFYNLKVHQVSGTSKNYHSYDKLLSKDKYTFTITFDKSKNLNLKFNNGSIFESAYQSSKLIYNDLINYWITNVFKSDSNIREDGKFCNDDYRYYKGNGLTDTFLPNENFKCDNNVKTPSITNSDFNYISQNSIEDKMVGFLSYGEYVMCENIIDTCELSDGYIYSEHPYILSTADNYSITNSSDTLTYKFSDNVTKVILNYHGQDWDRERRRYYNSTLTEYYITNETTASISLYPFRPVINLKSDIKLSGNGTINDPYVIIK